MKNYFLDMDLTLAAFPLKHGEMGTQQYRTKAGFFQKLKPYANIEAVNMAIIGKKNVYILSNSPTETADNDKRNWLDEFLPAIPEVKRIFNRGGLTANQTKAQVAETILGRKLTKNDILIDDCIKNLKEWEAAGGKAIHKQTRQPNAKKWNGENITRMTQLAKILQVA